MPVGLPVANVGAFVGLKILVAHGDRAIKPSSLELFFDKDVTFNMYLYNDMTKAPIYTKSVTASANEQVIVDLGNDAIVNYLTPAVNKGGLWYFGYYQADLGDARAIYYPINMTSFHACRIWSYSAPVTGSGADRNFVRNNIGANNLTYGLNLEVSTYVDATNMIVQSAGLFDELIGNVMAVRDITNIIYSYRSNATERNTQYGTIGDLYAELNGYKADGESPYVMGLKNIVNRAIKSVKGAFQQEDGNVVGIS